MLNYTKPQVLISSTALSAIMEINGVKPPSPFADGSGHPMSTHTGAYEADE
jgi:hypothetical protein